MQQHKLIPRSGKLKRFIHEEILLPPEAQLLKEKLSKCMRLRDNKVSWYEIQKVIEISRSHYYRIKKRVSEVGYEGYIRRSKRPHSYRVSKIPDKIRQLILKIRKENPVYGKSKIVVILRRDYEINISESTVGRILTQFMVSGKIKRYISSRKRRKRKFNRHAKRWEYGKEISTPGEMIQLDHMTVSKNQRSFKHFQAWDPITKTIVADVSSNAKSITAKRFLTKLIKELPFKVKSIQVDGGSEFMGEFEKECKRRNIPLFVLPPKKPKYNGGVERGNRIFRDEFYHREDLLADNIPLMKAELHKAVLKYNTFRPHSALKGMTPKEFHDTMTKQSHII